MPAPILPRLMRASRAAQYLDVSETTLRGLDIPVKVCGAMVFYDRTDLDDWCESLPYKDRGETWTADGAFG